MLKKLNNRTLIITFLVLLALVAIIRISSNQKGERNFRAYLAKVDTTQIDKIEIINLDKEPLVLTRTGKNQWQVKQGNKQARIDKDALQNLMVSFADLKVKRCVAVKKDKWKDYEVNDTLGTRVIISADGEQFTELIVGKFSYKRAGQSFSMSTNVRLPDEIETYQVEGQLSMVTRRDFNGFRDHTLLNVQADNIKEVAFEYPADSSFVLSQQNNGWMVHNMPADSSKVEKYLGKLNNVSAHNFMQEFDQSSQPVFRLNVTTLDGKTHRVEAYSEGEKYVFRTSQNPEAVFKESEHIFNRLFKPEI